MKYIKNISKLDVLSVVSILFSATIITISVPIIKKNNKKIQNAESATKMYIQAQSALESGGRITYADSLIRKADSILYEIKK